MIKNKLLSQILCVVIYIISFYVAFILTPQSIESIWLKITIWHLYATVFIYIFSVIISNSSLYDPFWSVAPIPIVVYLATQYENSLLLKILVLFPIVFWALRLTRNWIISWKGFEHEDFRYIDLKNTTKFKAEINNFFGIHLFPTFIVNLGLVPLLFILTNNISVNTNPFQTSVFSPHISHKPGQAER